MTFSRMSAKLGKNYELIHHLAGKCRSTVILNPQDYVEKHLDHLNNCPNELLKADPTKIKVKTLKQLKALKDNEFIDNENIVMLNLLIRQSLAFMVN